MTASGAYYSPDKVAFRLEGGAIRFQQTYHRQRGLYAKGCGVNKSEKGRSSPRTPNGPVPMPHRAPTPRYPLIFGATVAELCRQSPADPHPTRLVEDHIRRFTFIGSGYSLVRPDRFNKWPLVQYLCLP